MGIRTTAFSGLLLAVLVAAPSQAAPPVKGPTFLKGSGAGERSYSGLPFAPLRVGYPAHLGWAFQCPDGCVFRAEDGTRLELDPGAEGVFSDFTFARVDGNAPAVRVATLRLDAGGLNATAGARPFVVTTHGAMTAIRKGAARIVATAEAAVVGAMSGDVKVRTPSTKWETLEQGHAARVTTAGRLESAGALPRTPRWTGSGIAVGPVGIAFDESGAFVGVSWEPVKGATNYRVEIARDEKLTELVASTRVPNEKTTFTTRLPIGLYYASIRSEDGASLESVPAAVRPIRVVGVDLPNGSMGDAAKRTMVLPEARPLRLLQAPGVELALDKRRFHPGDTEVKMDEKASRPFWLRLKGEKFTETAFTLEKRALRADIDVTPHNARWPKDPLTVTVRIEDPSGRIEPSAVRPELKVMMGLEELTAQWTQKGSVYTTQIAPRPISFNTVVRVLASDEHGNDLGRGFVELEPSKMPRTALATR